MERQNFKMIIGDKIDFFIQLDLLVKDSYYYMGPLNFWIDQKAYPGVGAVITLNSQIMLLKDNLNIALSHEFKGSNLPIEHIDFDYEELSDENTIYWYLGELGDNGLRMRCEIVKDTLRLFYSMNQDPFKVKEISLIYYKKIIDDLFVFLKCLK
ncbi:hypothetical protein l11_05130 [Neisseria weaveri LMG 5135]|nr:hypothetical protein l11_05130 [Neisseria weaveri LMG 5135]